MKSYFCSMKREQDKNVVKITDFGLLSKDKKNSFFVGKDFNDFFDIISKSNENLKIFFLDLRLLGPSILYELKNKGAEQVYPASALFNKKFSSVLVETSKQYEKEFFSGREGIFYKTFIGDFGEWYSLTVYICKDGKYISVEMQDLSKIFVGASFESLSVDFLGIPYIYSIRQNCEILKKCYNFIESKGLKGITASACALNDFKESLKDIDGVKNKNAFDIAFPQLDEDVLKELYRAYRGGFCYVNTSYCGKVIGEGSKIIGMVLDFNGLYPYTMLKYPMPYGEPRVYDLRSEREKFKFHSIEQEGLLKIYEISCSFKIKEDGFKFIQLKGADLQQIDNYVNDVVISTCKNLDSSKGQIINLVLSEVDLTIFLDNYDVKDLEFKKVYVFKSTYDLFTPYVEKWQNKKKEGKIKGLKAQYKLAKIMLDSLGGKFGTKVERKRKVVEFDSKGVMSMPYVERSYTKSVYLPVALFMTSYARKELFEAINLVKKNLGKDSFIACDTDSIHFFIDMKHKNLSFIENRINEIELGKLKIENIFYKCCYIREKSYMIQVKKDGPIEEKYKVACAGLPKDQQKNLTFLDFEKGIKGVKKVYRPGVGGLVLKEEKFSIRRKDL